MQNVVTESHGFDFISHKSHIERWWYCRNNAYLSHPWIHFYSFTHLQRNTELISIRVSLLGLRQVTVMSYAKNKRISDQDPGIFSAVSVVYCDGSFSCVEDFSIANPARSCQIPLRWQNQLCWINTVSSDKASKQFQIHKSRSLCRTASLRPWIPWHLNKTCMRCDSAKNRSNTNSKVLSKQPRMLWHWHAIQVGFSGWKVDERLVFSWTLLGLSHRTTSPGSVVATLLL